MIVEYLGITFVILILLLVIVVVIKLSDTSSKLLIALRIFLTIVYIFAFAVMAIFLQGAVEYTEAIDPVGQSYTPLGHKHILTLIVFWTFSSLSVVILALVDRPLPPLLTVILIVFTLIGIPISIAVILQGYSSLLICPPIVYLFIALFTLYKTVKNKREEFEKILFKSQFLNVLNSKLMQPAAQFKWAVILLLPVFCLVVIVLLLFGQETDSIVKVFTETTEWNYSQMEHPEYLDHSGHYLCTVAACGHTSLVKPLRLGKRHGKTIIVNRQLLIANAFEERITELFPHLHKFIRHNYDKYGYPLSRVINTSIKSDITYILMKPLEYLFLICLYLLDVSPEKRINKQYIQ